MNIIYTNLVFVKSNFYQLNEVENILTKNLYLEKQKEMILKKDIEFKSSIIFKNVSFSYDGKKTILDI